MHQTPFPQHPTQGALVNRHIRRIFITAIAAAASISLAACGGSSSSSASSSGTKTVTIRVQSESSIAAEPLYLGVEHGFFKAEGLDVKIVDLPDVSSAIAATQSGNLELAFDTTIGVLQSARQGIKLTMVAPSDGINPKAADAPLDQQRNYTSVGVYTSKGSGITDMKGLKNATIAVPQLKAQPDATITSVLHEAGVDTKGIKWLSLGFVPALTALKSNQVDAAFLASPFTLQADQAGLKRVMNPSAVFFPKGSATSAWVASQSWAKKNPDTVKRFQRAIAKSAQYANDHIDEAKAHVIKRTGSKVDPKDMPHSYWPSTIDKGQLTQVDQKLVDIGFFPKPINTSTLITPPAAGIQ
nr:ABC transporter substrate-binding protein [Bifidobacterium tibiigranuli]